MTTLTQGIQPYEWLLSDEENRSRDVETVTVAGAVALPSGTVLGRITATGKLIKQVDAAADGSQVAVGVLGNPLAGVNGDYKAVVLTRAAEVIGVKLNGGAGPSTTAKAALKALGVVVR